MRNLAFESFVYAYAFWGSIFRHEFKLFSNGIRYVSIPKNVICHMLCNLKCDVWLKSLKTMILRSPYCFDMPFSPIDSYFSPIALFFLQQARNYSNRLTIESKGCHWPNQDSVLLANYQIFCRGLGNAGTNSTDYQKPCVIKSFSIGMSRSKILAVISRDCRTRISFIS